MRGQHDTRIAVDFNTTMMDPKERVYIGKQGNPQDDSDLLNALHPGQMVVLYDGDMEVEATVELDEDSRVWFGKPNWSTRRALSYPEVPSR
jgi:hypothetical protein